MPVTGLKYEAEMSTRSQFTKVKAEVALTVDGKELPNMGVLGEALELAVELIQKHITDSYKIVPPRTDTPIADVYATTAKNEEA
jgi:hypothetical protein